MTTLDLRKEAAPPPAFVSAAARFGVIEKPDLAFTPAVAR
ncbi:quinolinate synthase NadA, partial [Sinorhizobium meliloti]